MTERLEVLPAAETVARAQLREREADIVALHVAGYSYAETAQLRDIYAADGRAAVAAGSAKLRAARLAQRNET